MKVLVQPEDGIRLVLKGIAKATRSIQIVVFRFDQREIEQALAKAVTRGVSVKALIAHTNRAGEESLRKLELRLLAAGVTVARTADDLVRYHGKMMLIDGRELYLLAFNWTHLDIEHSRSFGVITRNRSLAHEAERLFEADTKRFTYEPRSNHFLVSPVNARKLLTAFLKGAKKCLMIYDPKISDPAIIRLLEELSQAGIGIQILGSLTRKLPGVEVRKLAQMRLHTRTIIRDGNQAFVGSQSLRPLELDARREVGVIFRDSKGIGRLAQTFNQDWNLAEQAAERKDQEAPATRVARKVAKRITKELPDVAPVIDGVVKEIAGNTVSELNAEEVEAVVKSAVKKAVKEAVIDIVQDAVEDGSEKTQ